MDMTPDYNAAPRNVFFSLPQYHDAIERCFECATSCWISADAFISERDHVSLKRAIEECLKCAEVCASTARALVGHKELSTDEIAAHLMNCIRACLSCSKEVSAHCGDHEHCLICVKTCEECLRVCEGQHRELLENA